MADSGSNRVTLKDISKEAGVSPVAVGRVLLGSGAGSVRVSEATAKKIREAAKRLNYRPNVIARQLAGKTSKLIGIIIDSQAPDVHKRLLAKMESRAAEQGYRFIIGQAHDDPKRMIQYIHDFESRGIEGLISLSHAYGRDADELAQTVAVVPNTVFLGLPGEGLNNANTVDVDYEAGMRKAVSYLHDNQRRNIGLMLFSSGTPAMICRAESYKKALADVGLPTKSALITEVSYGDVSLAGLKDPVSVLVDRHKIDALITCNDHMAAIVIKILKESGLAVPKDVAVIGQDNLDWGEFLTPALTTIDPCADQMAKAAMDMLFQLMKDEGASKDGQIVKVEPQLVVRESA